MMKEPHWPTLGAVIVTFVVGYVVLRLVGRVGKRRR